jgi:hypothetical protein
VCSRPRLLAASSAALAYSTYNLSQAASRPELLNQLSRALYRHQSLNLKRAFLDVAEKHAAIADERLQIERQRLRLGEIFSASTRPNKSPFTLWRLKTSLRTIRSTPNKKCGRSAISSLDLVLAARNMRAARQTPPTPLIRRDPKIQLRF